MFKRQPGLTQPDARATGLPQACMTEPLALTVSQKPEVPSVAVALTLADPPAETTH